MSWELLVCSQPGAGRMLILLLFSSTHLPPLPLVQQAGWNAPVSVGTAVAWGCLCGCGGFACGERCVLSGTVCVEMCIIPCIYLCTKEKREKNELLFSQSFLYGVGWGLGPGRRGHQLRQGCRSMRGAKGGVGGVRSPHVSTSPAWLPGAQPLLTGSPSILQRRQRFADKSRWMGSCVQVRLGCFGNGVGGEFCW